MPVKDLITWKLQSTLWAILAPAREQCSPAKLNHIVGMKIDAHFKITPTEVRCSLPYVRQPNMLELTNERAGYILTGKFSFYLCLKLLCEVSHRSYLCDNWGVGVGGIFSIVCRVILLMWPNIVTYNATYILCKALWVVCVEKVLYK